MARLNLFDLAPGKVLFDRYEIVRPHRQSGMAAAFEVKDGKGGASLELQAFPGSLFEGEQQAREFADKLRPWSDLRSSAVQSYQRIEVLEDGSVLLLADLPRGASLRSWLEEHGRMGAPEAVRLGLVLLEGLAEIHGAGLVHGDVKPMTIFFDEDSDHGTLLDGGITPGLWAAKHLGTRTALIGTPYYAALEQFTGDAPDASSDLYAVATVLFELLTGVMPWSGRSFVEVFQSKMQKVPPRMAARAPGVEVDPELERVVARGLLAEARERYATAQEFHDQLAVVSLS